MCQFETGKHEGEVPGGDRTHNSNWLVPARKENHFLDNSYSSRPQILAIPLIVLIEKLFTVF